MKSKLWFLCPYYSLYRLYRYKKVVAALTPGSPDWDKQWAECTPWEGFGWLSGINLFISVAFPFQIPLILSLV